MPPVIPNQSQKNLKINYSYDGNAISTGPSSNYDHLSTSLGRVQNTPIALGGDGKKVEALESEIWRELADFPFVDMKIDSYSTVAFNDSLYLFGSYIITRVVLAGK